MTSGVADTTEFGSALAVSGDRLGVVADGGVHIFDISAPKTPRRISHLSSADGGSAPAKDAPALAINDGFVALGWPEANEVHIFRERDGRFEHCRTVPAPSGSPNAFGTAVAVRHEQLVIGARGEQYRGAAYVTRPCQQTARVSRMTPMPGAGSDAFGFVVGSANGVVLVGAPQSRRVHVFTSLR